MNSINKLISIVNDSDIFSDNSSITKLLSILNNSSATAKNVSDAIELNPPLASRVLQLSNSPFFGGNGRITSIKKAITWIGFTQVKEITLNLSLSNLFTGGESIGDYNRKSLWKHSIAAGVMCKQIARKLFRERGDTQYSVGILHDFGFLIEDYFHHNELVNLLNSNELKKNKLEDLENNVFGFNHIDVTV
ncbi:MAG: HDOD domain-containing protein, partial [Candidatus Cloacimonadota bacterium]|nr:HDOD domain-containing protein [Candidatus Cloacimonadota bacterium]